jgi:hypothetical protein
MGASVPRNGGACWAAAMTPADVIVIRAPAGTKARWFKHAHPGKLGAWVVKMIDEPPDAERYLARFAAREPGSVVVLTEAELRDVMRKAYMAGAYRA